MRGIACKVIQSEAVVACLVRGIACKAILSEAFVAYLVRVIACKAKLSEAFVARDTVPGYMVIGRLSGRQYLVMSQLMARYCLTGSRTAILPRGLRPRLRTLRLVQPYRLVFNYMRILSKIVSVCGEKRGWMTLS